MLNLGSGRVFTIEDETIVAGCPSVVTKSFNFKSIPSNGNRQYRITFFVNHLTGSMKLVKE